MFSLALRILLTWLHSWTLFRVCACVFCMHVHTEVRDWFWVSSISDFLRWNHTLSKEVMIHLVWLASTPQSFYYFASPRVGLQVNPPGVLGRFWGLNLDLHAYWIRTLQIETSPSFPGPDFCTRVLRRALSSLFLQCSRFMAIITSATQRASPEFASFRRLSGIPLCI